MSFSTLEKSAESGRPVEIYTFVIGTTTYYYTSAPDSFEFGGNFYQSRQIERSKLGQSSEERQQQLEVTLPTEDEVASRFVGVVPADTMYLTVARYHRGDTESVTMWSGVIVGAGYINQGGQCKLRGLTTEGATTRTIPRFKYQGMCNHVLFDAGCGAIADDFLYTGTCGAKSGNTITVNGIDAAHGANWMVGGYVNLDDRDFRLVISQSGDVLTMYLPFENDPVGSTVKCYAGCSHNITDCENKFDNLERYGGFPFTPVLNPFVSGLQ